MKRRTIMGIEIDACKESRMAMRDAVALLSGKWKFSILMELATISPLRFKDLQEAIVGISPKVLSNELYDLEQNLLITRTVNILNRLQSPIRLPSMLMRRSLFYWL